MFIPLPQQCILTFHSHATDYHYTHFELKIDKNVRRAYVLTSKLRSKRFPLRCLKTRCHREVARYGCPISFVCFWNGLFLVGFTILCKVVRQDKWCLSDHDCIDDPILRLKLPHNISAFVSFLCLSWFMMGTSDAMTNFIVWIQWLTCRPLLSPQSTNKRPADLFVIVLCRMSSILVTS